MYKNQLTSEVLEGPLPAFQKALDEAAQTAVLMQRESGYHPWKLLLPDQVVLSAPLAELFNLPSDPNTVPLHALLDRCHVQDRGRFAAAITEAIERGTGLRGTFRILRPDGSLRTLHVAAEPAMNNHKIGRLQGIIKDSTDDVHREAVSISRSRLLRDVVGSIPSPVMILDRGMYVLDCSTVWLRSHRMLDRSDAVGHNYYALFPDTPAAWRAEYQRALAGEPLQATRSFVNPRTGNKIDCQCVIRSWDVSEDRIGGIVMLIGWSEFGVANAAQRSHVVEGFDGSLLDMLAQDLRATKRASTVEGSDADGARLIE